MIFENLGVFRFRQKRLRDFEAWTGAGGPVKTCKSITANNIINVNFSGNREFALAA
jgi:hypothetical protein